MDDFFNAIWKNEPYTITLPEDKIKLVIRKEVLQYCKRHDMFVLDYLQTSYKNGRSGLIFNTVENFNSQLPVSVFMGAINDAIISSFFVLVICPDELLAKWHYYMTWCSHLVVKVISDEESMMNIDPESSTVLLLAFSNLKLAQFLVDECYQFESVIIDKLDAVATKKVVKKLQGKFNIGITYRNFYTDPDQILQWSLLNWSNPGKVGKKADFPKIDNDNFANFRDNYKDFWVRITWDFCDSFKPPSRKAKEKLEGILQEWAKKHNLSCRVFNLPKRSAKRKRGKYKCLSSDEESDKEVPVKYSIGENKIRDDKSRSEDEQVEQSIVESVQNSVPENEEVEDVPLDIQKEELLSDNGGLSSTEEDLITLMGIKPKKPAKKTHRKHNKSIIDELLDSNNDTVNVGLSHVELQKSEQMILSAENDNILKELHVGASSTDMKVENGTSSAVIDFDVDSLISAAMEIANK